AYHGRPRRRGRRRLRTPPWTRSGPSLRLTGSPRCRARGRSRRRRPRRRLVPRRLRAAGGRGRAWASAQFWTTATRRSSHKGVWRPTSDGGVLLVEDVGGLPALVHRQPHVQEPDVGAVLVGAAHGRALGVADPVAHDEGPTVTLDEAEGLVEVPVVVL